MLPLRGCLALDAVQVWDLASGTLKLTLTGHISTVRGLAVSSRSPYLFSAGEDKMVKCWDLEYNKVIRHYHGHLSGVYSLSLHPTLDLLVTGGRDSVDERGGILQVGVLAVAVRGAGRCACMHSVHGREGVQRSPVG